MSLLGGLFLGLPRAGAAEARVGAQRLPATVRHDPEPRDRRVHRLEEEPPHPEHRGAAVEQLRDAACGCRIIRVESEHPTLDLPIIREHQTSAAQDG